MLYAFTSFLYLHLDFNFFLIGQSQQNDDDIGYFSKELQKMI